MHTHTHAQPYKAIAAGAPDKGALGREAGDCQAGGGVVKQEVLGSGPPITPTRYTQIRSLCGTVYGPPVTTAQPKLLV